MNKTLLIIILFTSVFLLIVYILKQRSNSTIPNRKYTIAAINKKEEKKNGALYSYTFQVNDLHYKGTFHHNNTQLPLGARYFVSFNSLDPTQSFLEIQQTVPETLTKSPTNGWEELP